MFSHTSRSGFGLSVDPVGALSRYYELTTKGDWKMLVSDQASVT